MMQKPKPKSSIQALAVYKPNFGAAGKKNLIRLSANESALGSSPAVMQALQNLDATACRYPEQISRGLVAAIADIENLKAEMIMPSNGSDELIVLLTTAYLEPGDEAIYTEYGFLAFPQAISIADGVPVIAKDDGMTVSVDAIIKKITTKTKLIFIANPNNPTGTIISTSEIERLIAATPPHVIIVLDGAYAEYVSGDDNLYTSGAELVERHDNVVMLRTFSKIYGLASLRLGWGYFPPAIWDVLMAIREPFSVNAAAALAGIAAINDRDFINQALEHNALWMPRMQDSIRQSGFSPLPSHGNFFLIKFADSDEAEAAYKFMYDRGILLRDMKPYNLPDCLRMSLGNAEEMELTIGAFKDFALKRKSK